MAFQRAAAGLGGGRGTHLELLRHLVKLGGVPAVRSGGGPLGGVDVREVHGGGGGLRSGRPEVSGRWAGRSGGCGLLWARARRLTWLAAARPPVVLEEAASSHSYSSGLVSA